MSDFEHGASGYTNHKCRCDACRLGNRADVARRRNARRAKRVEVEGRLITSEREHGLETTYSNYGCRCDLCRRTHAKLVRDYRARRAAT